MFTGTRFVQTEAGIDCGSYFATEQFAGINFDPNMKIR